MLRKLYNKVTAAWYLSEAFDKASKGGYRDALDALDRMGEYRDRLYDAFLLRGVLYNKLGCYEQTLDALTKAHTKIQRSRKLSPNKKAYLNAFACVAGQNAVYHLPDDKIPRSFPYLHRVDYSEVKLASVPAYMKRNFPLRGHPDWNEDARA